jgi:hypothetical protein
MAVHLYFRVFKNSSEHHVFQCCTFPHIVYLVENLLGVKHFYEEQRSTQKVYEAHTRTLTTIDTFTTGSLYLVPELVYHISSKQFCIC